MKYLKFILINLNIGFLFNLFPSIVLMNVSSKIQAAIILAFNCLFLIILPKKKLANTTLSSNRFFEFETIQCLFFILLIIQIFTSLFYVQIENLLFACSLFSVTFTFLLLIKRLENIHGKSFLMNSYSYLCLYILFSCLLVFLISSAGIFDPHSNLIKYGSFSEFDRNFVINHEKIYNPLNLIFIIESFRGIPFFGEYGLFVGLSHEPHTSMLFVMPGVFLFLINKSRVTQTIFWVLSFVFALITSSVTGIVVLLTCYILYTLVSKNKLLMFLKLSILFFITYLIYNQFDSMIQDVGLDIIKQKLNSNSSTSSKGVTLSLFEYLYTPKSFFGSGAFVNIGSEYAKDIGLVNFLIIVFIQLFFIIGLIKILLKAFVEPKYLYYFLSGLYFFLHSMKLGNLVFENVFYVLIIYILSTAGVTKKKNKALGNL